MDKNNRPFLFCGPLGCSLTRLATACVTSRPQAPNWFAFENRDVIFTHQARSAIALLCRLTDIKMGDEVIAPSYNCGAEIDPYAWSGANVVFYRITKDACIDVQDIYNRVTKSTRIVHVTHYWGWPQDIGELARFCEERGVLVVEDCALALFSEGSERNIGRIGDAAVYSFPKSLAVPDGGALVISKRIPNDRLQLKPPDPSNTFLRCLPLVKHWHMQNDRSWQHCRFTRNLLTKSWLHPSASARREARPKMLGSNYFDGRTVDWSMSPISKGIVSETNPVRVRDLRRRNYELLSASLFDIPGVRPLFHKLPRNVCPLAFPVFVSDRERWRSALSFVGIEIGGWPGYHPGYDWRDFEEASELKDNLITLPIHQDMTPRHLQHMAASIRDIAAQSWRFA